ncbi:MAG TPA: hypothetical protein DCS63_10290 [Elusimicrobia bacterium]|nr:hypothetical protein [Elusimicrobiota bacterium]
MSGVAQGCGSKAPELRATNRLETFAFTPASALEDRISAVPLEVLEYFRAEDKRPDYASYSPSMDEKKLLLDYLRLLPAVYERVFRARCAGIYFISGFTGAGVTDWVIGPGQKVYFYIILNPGSFKKSLSQTLTERERSCFSGRNGWDVRIEAGGGYKGVFYALAHEATHGLDYALGITPYTDNTMPEYYRPKKHIAGDLFMKTWAGYSQPHAGSDFPGRDRTTFYGLGGGPKLDISEAPALYKGLAGSGFVSLYGARTWAEDLAELATFGVLAKKPGQPYAIVLRTPAETFRVEPMRGAAGARAAEALGYMEKIK